MSIGHLKVAERSTKASTEKQLLRFMMPGGATGESFRATIDNNVPLPPQFCNENNWIVYADKLEQFFIAYKIVDDNQKRSLLLASLSLDVLETLTDLYFPEKPAEKTYKDVCAMMKSHFTPVVSIYRERREFYDTKQRRHESVVEFGARLKRSIRHCKFEKYYQHVLRDKFVVGLLGGPIREKVFQLGPTATLEECMETAMIQESIKAIDTDNSDSDN